VTCQDDFLKQIVLSALQQIVDGSTYQLYDFFSVHDSPSGSVIVVSISTSFLM
jgi:hypothetical protein